jgi:hypothetical protein
MEFLDAAIVIKGMVSVVLAGTVADDYSLPAGGGTSPHNDFQKLIRSQFWLRL